MKKVFLILLVVLNSLHADKLIVANLLPPGKINPWISMDKESLEISSLVHAGLIGIDHTLNSVEEIANSNPSYWNPRFEKNRGVELPISLKSNIVWNQNSSGIKYNNITSRDVVSSFQALKSNKDYLQAYKVENIERITSQGSNQVRIFFKTGQFSLNNLNFAVFPAALAKSRKEVFSLGSTEAKTFGAGAYRIKSWSPTGNIVLQSNSGATHKKSLLIDKILINVASDPNKRFNDLQNGNVDLITDLSAQTASQAKASTKVKVLEYPSTALTGLFFNLRPVKGKNPNRNYNLLRNKHFRRAINLAIDKETIYRQVYRDQGYVFPGITGPFLPGSGAYNDKLKDYAWTDKDYSRLSAKQRQKKAIELLKNMGLSEGSGDVKIDLLFLAGDGGRSRDQHRIARSIANALKPLGIKVNRISKDKASYYRQLEEGDFDLVLYDWNSSLNPGVGMWDPRKGKDGDLQNTRNFSGYEFEGRGKQEYLMALNTIKYGRKSTKKIMLAYHKLHSLLHDDGAAVFLWNQNQFIAINPKFSSVLVKDPVNFLRSVKDWR